jgi:hypothetical protein
MPQLDTATFRGQVTWLVIVFVVLYRTRRGDVLPKVSRIVKLRSKKRDRTRGDATQYDGERTRVENGYSARLGNAAGSSYGLLQETMDVQTNWMNKEVVNRNQSKGMKNAMKKYRSYRMNVKLADVYLSKKLSSVGDAGKKGKVDQKSNPSKTASKTTKKGKK